jgi:hypothetical protein
VHLRSRNEKDFSARYSTIAKGLAAMPDETVIDGGIVALDGAGRPSFSALQNSLYATGQLLYYVFGVMIAAGEDVMAQPLAARREITRHPEKAARARKLVFRKCTGRRRSLRPRAGGTRGHNARGHTRPQTGQFRLVAVAAAPITKQARPATLGSS